MDRRQLLTSATLVVAAGALSGCSAEATEAVDKTVTGQKPTALAKTSDIPVRGGKTYKLGDTNILITQPKDGEFRAFVAQCTHAGAKLDGAENNEIKCLNHGAKFNAENGMVTTGPAQRALAKVTVSVEGDDILVSF